MTEGGASKPVLRGEGVVGIRSSQVRPQAVEQRLDVIRPPVTGFNFLLVRIDLLKCRHFYII
jgi:hypothetical protein